MKKLIVLLGLLTAAIATAQPNCALTNIRCVGTGQEYTVIQTASDAAVAGDEVYVFVGNYVGWQLVSGHAHGTLSSPIRFVAESTLVVIASAGNGSGDGINIDSVNYITVDGFAVTGSLGRTGIRVATSIGTLITHNVLDGCTTQCLLTGFTPDLQVISNIASNAVQQHGIYISNSNRGLDHIIVRGNVTHHNALAGIQFNGDCTTLDGSGNTDGMLSGLLIEANVAYNNGGDGFSIINMSYSTIRNNLLYNNAGGAGAMKFADQGCGYGNVGNLIVNNTIYGTTVGFRIVLGTNMTFFNNIVVSDSFKCVIDATAQPCDGAGSGGTGNNYQIGIEATTAGSTSLFTNQAGGDYTLAVSSPAINTGVSTYNGYAAPKTDLLNNSRPVGAYDIGAYERGASAAAADTTAPSTPGTPSAVGSAYQIALTWTASTDNVEVVGYQIFRDGTPYGSALLNSFTDLAITPGATYVYTVSAYDDSNNISATSTVTTSAYGIVGCMNADPTFRSVIIPEQKGVFSFETDITAFGSGTTNGVIGLASKTPTGFSDFAVIVTFALSGNILARDGASYRADIVLPYVFGDHYHIRGVVDVPNHQYSIFITPPMISEEELIHNAAFRTEQAGATALSWLGTFNDTGANSVCGPLINGLDISTKLYENISQQELSTQVTSVRLLPGNGFGLPLLDHPDSVTLTGAYTLQASDNATMKVYNGSTPIIVTVPTGLGVLFNCTIVQQSTGTVTFVGSGLSLINRSSATHTAGVGSAGVVQCTIANTCNLWGDVVQ